MNKKIIILHFETEEVLIYNYNPDIWESCEDFIESETINFNSSNCQCMVVDEVNIKIK